MDLNAKQTIEVMESERRLRTTFDNMLEGVQIIDFNWRYQYLNDVQLRQNKNSKEDLLGYTMMEKYPGIERTELFEALERSMTKRVAHQMEVEFTFPDASIGWFEISIQPVPEGLLILSLEVTDRKKAEKQFQESESFSSAVLASLTSHVAVIDAKGIIVSVNKAWDNFAKENGETRLERVSVGSNYFEVCKKSMLAGDPYAEKALEGIQSVFRKEKDIFELEYPCDAPDEQRWFILRVTRFGEQDNKVVTSHINITSRKIAEEANRASETKYRRLFETAQDGILILDAASGKIEDVNPYMIKILGFPYEYFIGKELWEIGVFKDVEASKIAFRELQEKEYIRYNDLPLQTKDGEHLNVEFVSNVYLVNDQKVIQCNIRDITERIAAAESLKKSEIRLRAAQAISHTANWEIDLGKDIHTWSDEFYTIFGIEKGTVEPSAEAFLNLMSATDREMAEKEMQAAFIARSNSNFNFTYTGNDGTLKHAYTEWKFEFDKNNNPIRLYGIIQDRTERKKAEEKLEQQNLELKKTNTELDRFVYSTSHDLRAPLTSVMGLINIIEGNLEPEDIELKEQLEMMKESIVKLDSFIEDILSYSRNSRMEIEEDEINFKALIQQSRNSLKYMKGDSGFKVNVEVVQTGKFISDRRRICAIVNNLISNAIKYHDKPGPHANVSVHSDATQAIITVEDNGMGIADEKQEKIFEMFYRATKLSKGSGLGLYIAKETVKKLNGTITVASKLNSGTTFSVTIPNLIHKTENNETFTPYRRQ